MKKNAEEDPVRLVNSLIDQVDLKGGIKLQNLKVPSTTHGRHLHIGVQGIGTTCSKHWNSSFQALELLVSGIGTTVKRNLNKRLDRCQSQLTLFKVRF